MILQSKINRPARKQKYATAHHPNRSEKDDLLTNNERGNITARQRHIKISLAKMSWEK